jgi:GTP-binding protein Era
MKAGFVSIFGKPNAGKSTLLNAMMGEKLAIVSPKVQTTRHRIKAILNGDGYQMILSDTPGIIEPKYKLQEKMMDAVKGALEDADLVLLVADINDDRSQVDELFSSLKLSVPAIVVINKSDTKKQLAITEATDFYWSRPYATKTLAVSALSADDVHALVDLMVSMLPEGEPFFEDESLSDLPEKFFVSEMIREKIFFLYEEEIPYHTTVLVTEYKQKSTLLKIAANIVVQRETQKGIILGEGGRKIKQLGTEARKEIEAFTGQKVFLELFVKVRPKWRDNENMLREYGYS